MSNSESADNHIVNNNISVAWAEVISKLLKASGHQMSPFLVTINIDEKDVEVTEIRNLLDSFLRSLNKKDCLTIANTIFPYNIWDKSKSAKQFYEKYLSLWPKIREYRSNKNGTYFQRLICYNIIAKDSSPINQLKYLIDSWKKKNKRRSEFQASIFDPRVDHSPSPYKEFPCLQQVSFNPLGHNGIKGLEITGFYANQLAFEKAYGNYLGLYRLGLFVAHEMKLRLVKVNCFTANLKLTNENNNHLILLEKEIERVNKRLKE